MSFFLFLFLLIYNSFLYSFQVDAQALKHPFLPMQDTIFKEKSGGTTELRAKFIKINEKKKIAGWHLDGQLGGLLLELENRQGYASGTKYRKDLIMTEPQDFSIRWQRKIDNADNTVISDNNFLFLELKKNTARIDPSNGTDLWKVKKKLYYVIPDAKLGLFYPQKLSSNKLSAINLKTGDIVWETIQKRRYGWDDVSLYDQQTLLIASEGISFYNISNGIKGEYRAKTAYKDTRSMIVTNAVGFLFNLISTAIFEDDFEFMPYQDKINTSSNIMSNVCIDEKENLYLASVDKIACITNKGKIIWSSKLPKEKTSKSSLFLHNGHAVLLNRGYANYNHNPTALGEAYVASFDMRTGENIFFEKIFSNDFEPINNFQVVDNTLFVIIGNRVQTYDLTNGMFEAERTVNMTNPLTGAAWFIDGGIYVKDQNDNFRDIMDTNPEWVHVINKGGNVISLDKSLSVMKTYGINETFELYLKKNGFTFLHHVNGTTILNGESMIAELPFKLDGFLTDDNTLYHIGKNEILKINLTPVSSNKNLMDIYEEVISKYLISAI